MQGTLNLCEKALECILLISLRSIYDSLSLLSVRFESIQVFSSGVNGRGLIDCHSLEAIFCSIVGSDFFVLDLFLDSCFDIFKGVIN